MFEFLGEGKIAGSLYKMTAVKRKTDQATAPQDPFQGPILPLGSNPGSLAWPEKLP